jgi:hypothetical protein
MRHWREVLLWAVLIAVCAAIALAAGTGAGQPVSRPSITDAGPAGLAGLFRYLETSGRRVSAQSSAWDTSPDARTIVLAGIARSLDASEVEVLSAFVHRGGTLVYLAAAIGAQPELEQWLNLSRGKRTDPGPILDGERLDVTGATAQVHFQRGPLFHVHQLRVGAGSTLTVESEDVEVVASVRTVPVAFVRHLGDGRVWIFAGPDIAENRRVELLDNLHFWDAIAQRGPMLFDEYHHQTTASARPLRATLGPFLGQLFLLATGFVFARSARFGDPRPLSQRVDRSSLEYVQSFARLTRRARVEPELVQELLGRLSSQVRERVGSTANLSDPALAEQLALRTNRDARTFHSLIDDLRAAANRPDLSPTEYARLCRRCVPWEAAIAGRPDPRSRENVG